MKKTGKLIALALSLGMVLGLAACGGGGGAAATTAAGGGGTAAGGSESAAAEGGTAGTNAGSHYVNDKGKVVVNLQRTEGMQSLNIWNYTSGPNYAFAEMVYDSLYVSDHGGYLHRL